MIVQLKKVKQKKGVSQETKWANKFSFEHPFFLGLLKGQGLPISASQSLCQAGEKKTMLKPPVHKRIKQYNLGR